MKNPERFKQEILILQKLDNPYILKMYEYFEDEAKIWLVTEYCRGGDLFEKMI